MEQIFWVKNGELGEVNKWLQKGGRVKMIKAVSETISSYGYSGVNGDGNMFYNHSPDNGRYIGDIYAYVVVEFD